MKINIVYKEEKGWFVGHIQEYPDYESQGKTLEELRNNLIEIYDDIRKGLVLKERIRQILGGCEEGTKFGLSKNRP